MGYISRTTDQKAFIFRPWAPWKVYFLAMSFGPRVHAPGSMVLEVKIYYTFKKCFQLFIPLWGYTVFRLSGRPAVTFWFFLNILKRQLWKFIYVCRPIDVDEMYIYNRKLKARGQFCWELLPFVILNGPYVVHIRGIQLVPQLLLKCPDTLYTQCRHIEHLHEGV